VSGSTDALLKKYQQRISYLENALKFLHIAGEDTENSMCVEEGVVKVLSPINLAGITEWANRMGTRLLHCGDRSWYEILECFIARARTVEGRSGHWVEDMFGEAAISAKLGFKQNLEVRSHCGAVSAFAAPKGIRYIVRCGVPGVKVVDVVNSHLVHLLRSLSPEERLLGVTELEEIVSQRELVFDRLLLELNQPGMPALDRVDIKKLILGVTYGGSFVNLCQGRGCPDWITKFGETIRRIANFRAERSPELICMLRDGGKRDPAISLLSHQVTLEQRKTVDAIAALVPQDRHISYERDGFAYVGEGPSLEEFQAVAGIPLTMEGYMSPTELEKWMRGRYPHIDWDARSQFNILEIRRARSLSVDALSRTNEKGEPKVPRNHADFAVVVAAKLEARVCIMGESSEVFDTRVGSVGRWLVRKTANIKVLLRRTLLDSYRMHMKPNFKADGKVDWVRAGDVPVQLKESGLQNTIIDQIRTLLTKEHPLPLDNSETCRQYLMDENGVVYDFHSDTFIRDTIGLRLSRHLPWIYGVDSPDGVWHAPDEVKTGLSALLRRVLAFWQMGDVKTRALADDPVAGPPLAACLLDFVEKNSEHCTALHTLLGIYNGSVDEALWKLLHMTANACAFASRCEFVYQYGPGNSGKDTEHLIMLSFFGDGHRGGLSGVLPSNFFVGARKNDVEGPTSVMDSMRGLRYISNNEIPQHECFNSDVIKGLVEAEGTPLTSRSMRENPSAWRPMAGLFLSSNHLIRISDEERHLDSGLARRLNVVRMPRVFPDTDNVLKSRIVAGGLNTEVFWLIRHMYPHVRFLGGRKRLYPIPPRIRRETADLLVGDFSRLVQVWVEENCEAANVYRDATSVVTVREAITQNLFPDMSVKEAKTRIVAAGLVEKVNGSVRVYVYAFPTEVRPKAVRLKAHVSSASFRSSP
jgi:hypothetical protein